MKAQIILNFANYSIDLNRPISDNKDIDELLWDARKYLTKELEKNEYGITLQINIEGKEKYKLTFIVLDNESVEKLIWESRRLLRRELRKHDK